MPDDAQGAAADGKPGEEQGGAHRSDREAPRVFVSYAHEDAEHKAWVRSLAEDLCRNGVNAILDQWDARLGDDLTLFIERSVRGARRVLLVCTPTYARKANEGEGGVGYERLVVTGELAKKIDTSKFVCVLRAGKKEDAIPTFAQSRMYIDFTDGVDYALALEQLVRDLHEAPVNPKPPLGPNPFESGSQQNAVRSAGLVTTRHEPDLDIAEVARRAENLLRQKDILGWRRFVQGVRARYPETIARWCEHVASRRTTAEHEWLNALQEAVEATAPLVVTALMAVQSDIDGVRNQAGLLDDILRPEAWPTSGLTRLISAPEALGTVYHHLTGSLCVANGRHADAISLLLTKITVGDASRSYSELWRQHRLMGWTDSLGHNCETSWRFLLDLHDQHSWLNNFYSSPKMYRRALRSYQMLASLLELAEFAAAGRTSADLEASGFLIDVPPMFLLDSEYTGNAQLIVSHAVPDRWTLDLIASSYGTTSAKMTDLWPAWFVHLSRRVDRLDRSAFRADFGTPPALP